MIIDNWLFQNNITHEKNVPYGVNNMTADFKVRNTWIEFFGLKGELKKYDQLMEKKKMIFKERKLQIIEIYPNDLFPVNRLSYLFRNIVTK